MLVLKCTTCGATLELDDAFAGGVCRCIHCGTIQTVPNQLRPIPAAKKKAAPAPQPPPVETAPIVIDTPSTPGGPVAPRSDDLLWKVLYGVAGLIVVGLIVLVWLALRTPSKSNDAESGDHASPSVSDGTTPAPAPDVAPTTPAVTPSPPPTPTPPQADIVPTFCGVPLHAQSLIYCIDRSSKVQSLFIPTNKALIASLKTLRPDQRFQIIYWGNKEEPDGTAIPPDGMVQATPMAVAAAITAIDSVRVSGDDLLKTAVQKAVAQKPELMLFISGKATHELELADRVMNLRNNAPIRIDTILIDGRHSEAAMKSIAQRSGGEYKFLTFHDLNQFGQ